MGRLTALVERSYSILMEEGIDAWIEKVATPDFVWDVSPMGLGRFETHDAFRRFYLDWTSSYEDWFIESGEVEEISDAVAVNPVRQGGRLHGGEQIVDLRYGQLGVWEGDRLKLAVNYPSLGEARAASEAMLLDNEA